MGVYEAQSAAMVAASDFWNSFDSCVGLLVLSAVDIFTRCLKSDPKSPPCKAVGGETLERFEAFY